MVTPTISENSEESEVDADGTAKKYIGQRWEYCRRCYEEYDVLENKSGSCEWIGGNLPLKHV